MRRSIRSAPAERCLRCPFFSRRMKRGRKDTTEGKNKMGERDFRTLGGPHVIRGVQQKISKNEKIFSTKMRWPPCWTRRFQGSRRRRKWPPGKIVALGYTTRQTSDSSSFLKQPPYMELSALGCVPTLTTTEERQVRMPVRRQRQHPRRGLRKDLTKSDSSCRALALSLSTNRWRAAQFR